jgi:branched-chain amino acid transport system ATP-binding protein
MRDRDAVHVGPQDAVGVIFHLGIALEIAARHRAGADWDLPRILDLFPALAERLASRAATLSGGEQQMLALARALLGNPSCLLLDEPTEGLSPFLVERIARLLGELKAAGLALLLVEQNIAFALQCADRVQIMDKGRIVHESVPGELAADSDLAATYLGL